MCSVQWDLMLCYQRSSGVWPCLLSARSEPEVAKEVLLNQSEPSQLWQWSGATHDAMQHER